MATVSEVIGASGGLPIQGILFNSEHEREIDPLTCLHNASHQPAHMQRPLSSAPISLQTRLGAQ